MTEHSSRQDVTTLLTAVAAGDRHAAEALLPLVYDELRRLARARLARVPPGNTLQPTALVHEAYLRLVGDADPGWNGRGHFFGAAARAMRLILVEQTRRKGRLKRGGDRRRADQDLAEIVIETPAEDMVALDAALADLEREDPRSAEVVMLRYFAGLSEEQAAEVLDVSTRTVRRDWKYARAWLQRAMDEGDG